LGWSCEGWFQSSRLVKPRLDPGVVHRLADVREEHGRFSGVPFGHEHGRDEPVAAAGKLGFVADHGDAVALGDPGHRLVGDGEDAMRALRFLSLKHA